VEGMRAASSNDRTWSYAYIFIALVLISILLMFIRCQFWAGDFWHHAAIVRELTKRPLSPQNPFYITGPETVLYWPYAFLVSRFALLFDVSPHVALAWMGVTNLLLFMIGFRLFVRTIIATNEKVVLFGILFILFFWGQNPIGYSGFFHIDVLFLNASYPSTFAVALCFFLLACYSSLLGEHALWKPSIPLANGHVRLFICTIGAALVLLCHPLTFIMLCVWMIALTYEKSGLSIDRRYRSLAVILGLSICAGFLWPFFPLEQLAFSLDYVADPSAYYHYTKLVERYYLPFLIGLPLLVLRWRQRPRDALLHAFLFFMVIYLYGYLSRSWNYGRVLSFAIMILQLAIADWVVALPSRIKLSKVRGYIPVFIAASFFILLFHRIWTFYLPGFRQHLSVKSTYSRLQFLEKHVRADQTILSTVALSKFIPSFGPKIVVFDIAPFFPEDFKDRERDVKRFLDNTDNSIRNSILEKYNVTYVLLPMSELKEHRDLSDYLEANMKLVYYKDELKLYQL